MFGSVNLPDHQASRFTTLKEFETKLPIVGLALRDMQDVVNRYGLGGSLRFGFEFPHNIDKDKVTRILNHYQFPTGVEVYQVNGVRLFELRMNNVTAGWACYLFAE